MTKADEYIFSNKMSEPIATAITIESLSSKCRTVIATNIDRYPIKSFSNLPEMEWEAIIELKYRMTAPKHQTQIKCKTSLLSDGRKFPLFTDKFMKEVEERNGHLKTSVVADDLVWRDLGEWHKCVFS